VKFAGLKADRQEVIAGGVAVLAGVFETLGITEMRPARGALRVGVLYDLLGRRESRDIRDATVERLMTRFAVDRAQAERVLKFAHLALAQMQPKLDEDAAKRLVWAAQLHEVGFAISHNDYHKHGAYLVQHADLAGFSTNEQERVALLVLGQRGNLRKVSAALEDPQRIAKVLALRLAVIMAHARRDVDVPRWSVKLSRGAIDLALDGEWLARHPLTQHLLEEEAEQWAKVGIKMSTRAA
jgi:exopolyphosphatase/guanosine-5'-triphosphate,3'-diphosphate pyrophosphatase